MGLRVRKGIMVEESEAEKKKIKELEAGWRKSQRENDNLSTRLKETQKKLDEESFRLKKEVEGLTHRLNEAEKGLKSA